MVAPVLASNTAATPWPMPPFLRASVALHLLAAGGMVAMPGSWPLALGALAANHAAITALGLWPRSSALGPNVRTLPAEARARRAIAWTFDDGPDPEVTPRLLDQLDEHRVRATFFCIATRAGEHPGLLREIVARGHDLGNHSLTHRHSFSLLGPAALKREIGDAQRRLEDLSGTSPLAFRPPAGLRNPFLDPVLHALNLHLVSWTRRGFDTVAREREQVWRRLAPALVPGSILLLHDGHAAREASGTPLALALLPRLLAEAQTRGLHAETLRQALPPRHGRA